MKITKENRCIVINGEGDPLSEDVFETIAYEMRKKFGEPRSLLMSCKTHESLMKAMSEALLPDWGDTLPKELNEIVGFFASKQFECFDAQCGTFKLIGLSENDSYGLIKDGVLFVPNKEGVDAVLIVENFDYTKFEPWRDTTRVFPETKEEV